MEQIETPSTTDKALLLAAAVDLGIQVTASQCDQLVQLRTLLLDWNTRMNLTAITDPSAILVRHIIDAFTCIPASTQSQTDNGIRLLDIGSGAGFPALVLAIVCPQWQIVSIEATGKKVTFQQAVIEELGLNNAIAIAGRAETIIHTQGWRGSFTVVTARALAALPTLFEWCQPYVKPHGVTLAPKKGDFGAEFTQSMLVARMLGGEVPDQWTLPAALTDHNTDLADGRVIVRVRQQTVTPEQ